MINGHSLSQKSSHTLTCRHHHACEAESEKPVLNANEEVTVVIFGRSGLASFGFTAAARALARIARRGAKATPAADDTSLADASNAAD